MTPTLGVGLIGYAFMGAAHSHAWRTAPHFFDLPLLRSVTVKELSQLTMETASHLSVEELTGRINPAYQQTGPVWEKYYSAKEAYGPAVDPPLTDPLAELTPVFWHNLTEACDKDQKLFDEYVARKSRG